jgi:hypothetical protein
MACTHWFEVRNKANLIQATKKTQSGESIGVPFDILDFLLRQPARVASIEKVSLN